ncbi:hypothetical protein GLYMA_13G146751v4 [Glycine max]|nr:hypothetical protein GLYMA_13G146751v4 [Glycine max]KAG4383725.1 hypothetical protein GLYMA_13G146751v4 [Glycine max]KAG4383726.1 hypothetical protein GLYMA_13G146751v4 [Glycine max]KAG4383727.1 hypothetical protein GLYMA_13G146751v4 [Glycine max]KAG4383728.1 hypothetical protein GLYMA_13G146751v4 [Glycine max]
MLWDRLLDLRKTNPLHLRSVIEDKRYSKCRFVILYASHPYSKEASYLASVYSQVYLDFGLAIPKLSVHGMTSAVKDLLNLAPINKVRRILAKLFSLFCMMHALMVSSQFLRLWKLQKTSLHEMQSASIRLVQPTSLPLSQGSTDVQFNKVIMLNTSSCIV